LEVQGRSTSQTNPLAHNLWSSLRGTLMRLDTRSELWWRIYGGTLKTNINLFWQRSNRASRRCRFR